MELADELNAKVLPIPTEQRADVYVVTPNDEMCERWLQAAGASTFHYRCVSPYRCLAVHSKDVAQFCGVALFTLDNPHRVPGYVYQALQPFFERAGREANVFEFCPVQRHFTRRDEQYILARVS